MTRPSFDPLASLGPPAALAALLLSAPLQAGEPGSQVLAGGPARPQVQGRPLAMDDLVAWCMLATPAPGLDHWDVCWLPDGDSVLFSYLQHERPGLFRVYLGTRQVSPWLGAERLQYPKCSPQGRVFAMEWSAPDSAAARPAVITGSRVFLPDRGTWEEVAVPGAQYANWTRDGQALIGLNGNSIERFSLATRHSEVIADVRSLTLAQVPGSNRWMGLDATDAPLVTRDATTFDLYALDWEAP